MCYRLEMATNAKEFIDFWMLNSVHAKSEMGQGGGSQDAEALAARLYVAADEQGISADDIAREIGDPVKYIKARLVAANVTEFDRRHPKT